MPAITVEYYLVLVADPERRVPDGSNRSNDLCFVSGHHAIHFDAGYSNKQGSPFSYTNPVQLPDRGKAARNHNAEHDPSLPNGYNTAEIRMALNNARQNGNWDRWVQEYQVRKSSLRQGKRGLSSTAEVNASLDSPH